SATGCLDLLSVTSEGPFFFQAEDGIRGRNVTGVQTCALPIYFLPESKRKSRRMLYMQLQGMIMSPFNLKIEWDTTLLDDYGRTQFVRQYTNELNEWLDFLKAFEYET